MRGSKAIKISAFRSVIAITTSFRHPAITISNATLAEVNVKEIPTILLCILQYRGTIFCLAMYLHQHSSDCMLRVSSGVTICKCIHTYIGILICTHDSSLPMRTVHLKNSSDFEDGVNVACVI